MKKRTINNKYIQARLPVGLTAISWLLYRQVQPTGTFRGVFLTLVIGYNVLIWVLCIASFFLITPSTPVFKEEQ